MAACMCPCPNAHPHERHVCAGFVRENSGRSVCSACARAILSAPPVGDPEHAAAMPLAADGGRRKAAGQPGWA